MKANEVARRGAAELLGTALLVAAVVGSGIMGANLTKGDAALTLLANSTATGAALVALILTFGPISGAHFNPLVTLVDVLRRGTRWWAAPIYIGAQVAGAVVGVIAANKMFGRPGIDYSHNVRAGTPLLWSEALATFGLVAIVVGSARTHITTAAFAVGGYIAAAYWFTSSTSFANPAVTIGRALTDSFTGIRPADVLGFIAAQAAGAAAAAVLFQWLVPPGPTSPPPPSP